MGSNPAGGTRKYTLYHHAEMPGSIRTPTGTSDMIFLPIASRTVTAAEMGSHSKATLAHFGPDERAPGR